MSISSASRPLLGPTQPRPEREADHLPPSNAEVKNAWSYTSTLPYVFMAWCLIKQWIRLLTAWYLIKQCVRLHGMLRT
jgi:hypothetical protein